MAQRSLGIVGAGQLAQMLVEAAHRIEPKIECTVLSENPRDPAVLAGARLVQGSSASAKTLEVFFRSCDRVLFENEFFPQSFEVLAEKFASAKQDFFVPSLETLKLLRNKLSQKKLLKACGIPTPEFIEWTQGGPYDFLKQCVGKFSEDFVIKWALGGYDGKGVLLSSHFREAPSFLKKAQERSYPVYAEQKVHFESEWAVIGVRSLAGELVFFPFVRSEQRQGVCFEVQGFDAFSAQFDDIRQWIRQLAEKSQLTGAFGVELFRDVKQRFWVNEIAPRVHNSGHYTQDAFEEDQFDYHLKVATEDPLPAPRAKFPYWGMINLLGPTSLLAARAASRPASPSEGGLFLHWYDKAELRAARKMGHLNWVANSEAEATIKRQRALDWVSQWEGQVSRG